MEPNPQPPSDWEQGLGWTSTLNSWGYSVVGRYADVPFYSDGSMYLDVPCETPIIMTGLDSNGAVISRDQMPMSLRPGESREFGGCHLHEEIGAPFAGTEASKKPPAPLRGLTPVPTWKDVKPYLEATCIGCHSKAKDPWLYEYADLVLDYKQESRSEPAHLRNSGATSKWLNRPNTSAWGVRRFR